MDADVLAENARSTGVGEVVPSGEHVMVPVQVIRRLAEGRVDAAWPDKLAGMVAYPVRKGWTNADATAVRAHVDRR